MDDFLHVLNITPHYADEMHLLPQVEPPGNIGVSVVLITGPAVQLGLNDLLLNR